MLGQFLYRHNYFTIMYTKNFFILVKGKEILPLVDASVVRDVRRELTAIRDKVNSLLDALDITDKVPSKHPPDQHHLSSPGRE